MKNLPKLYDLEYTDIDSKLILSIILATSKRKKIVVTPLSVLGVTGFPISDQTVVLKNKKKIRLIKDILSELEQSGYLKRRSSRQDFLGRKEVAYDLMDNSK